MALLFNPKAFGDRVAAAIEKHEMTIREAADQMDVPKATLHRVTQGLKPDVENYLRITKWLETHA